MACFMCPYPLKGIRISKLSELFSPDESELRDNYNYFIYKNYARFPLQGMGVML